MAKGALNRATGAVTEGATNKQVRAWCALLARKDRLVLTNAQISRLAKIACNLAIASTAAALRSSAIPSAESAAAIQTGSGSASQNQENPSYRESARGH